MKPKVYWKYGEWLCRLFAGDVVGRGRTPLEAYQNWLFERYWDQIASWGA